MAYCLFFFYFGSINFRSIPNYSFYPFPVDDESTIISWRSVEREFAYKQVNRLLTSYHQLSVLQRGKIQKLEIPTIPRGWHHVAFTSSLVWDLKFYQNGVLVNETGRVRPSTVETQADNLFIIGNRTISSGVKPSDNFQIYGLTVWPRRISQPQIQEQLTEGTSSSNHKNPPRKYHIFPCATTVKLY